MSSRTVNGSTRSENGWRLVNRDECVLVPGPFMNTAPLRAGAPAVVLGDFVRRYHVEVAPVISSVWGWSRDNDVLGSYGGNNGSNHLGGTAIDVNATLWPWGTNRMPRDLVDRTQRLVESYGGAVFWGRAWRKPDEMHFQCWWPEGDGRWPALVARINGQPVVSPPIAPTPSLPNGSWNPTLQYGSTGAAVAELQRDFNRIFGGYPGMPLTVDGDFGPGTRFAVQEFQRRATEFHLTADGVVGPLTWVALNKYGVKL